MSALSDIEFALHVAYNIVIQAFEHVRGWICENHGHVCLLINSRRRLTGRIPCVYDRSTMPLKYDWRESLIISLCTLQLCIILSPSHVVLRTIFNLPFRAQPWSCRRRLPAHAWTHRHLPASGDASRGMGFQTCLITRPRSGARRILDATLWLEKHCTWIDDPHCQSSC